MPEQETLERARRDKRQGKSPSTQAGEFVREEIHHVREGKHGARSAKQAIAIGLSKARRAGVKLPKPRKASAATRRSAASAARAGRTDGNHPHSGRGLCAGDSSANRAPRRPIAPWPARRGLRRNDAQPPPAAPRRAKPRGRASAVRPLRRDHERCVVNQEAARVATWASAPGSSKRCVAPGMISSAAGACSLCNAASFS